MKRAVLGLVLLFCLAGSANGFDFEVTDTINLGFPKFFGSWPPARWSPDGGLLAYFAAGRLMVADTLGSARPVSELRAGPERFCWASNTEVIVGEADWGTMEYSLNKYDIVNGSRTEITSFVRQLASPSAANGSRGEAPPLGFIGPFASVEGLVYYGELHDDGYQWRLVSRGSGAEEAERLAVLHLYRLGKDGMYLVALSGEDSVLVAEGIPDSGAISPDQRYLAFGQGLRRLSDNRTIHLDSLPQLRELPEGAAPPCGMWQYSFNPRHPEVAFLFECFARGFHSHRRSYGRVAIFDYELQQLVILNEVLGTDHLHHPLFHPNGVHLCVTSEHGLYIVKRRMKP